MYYTVYQVTNLVNGKIYIGKHVTKDLNDGYMGSGKWLRRAIEKYGLESFSKDILFVFDNEDEMNLKEAEIVTEKFCNLKSNYNLCPGGHGGFGYLNSNGLNGSIEGRIKSGKIIGAIHSERIKVDEIYRTKFLQRIKKNLIAKPTPFPKGNQYGKDRWKNSNLERPIGSKNPNFGKTWIKNNELKLRKMVLKSELELHLKDGWILGNCNSFMYLK